ncbi:phosphoglycolate phosphatase [Kockovaella imperatae]|uniref:Phosphoglycolate phosphatase n=1 Tax=Kockovaella imperatae TaxID=4999 RepID=A0A1Y1U987_9TREE|nr:phosphoglycolate phosphatase [Kockovaella imperatae]ORX34591.1 phosphoglycolate phosphatase [Kockovaella imperatae]
MPQIKYLLFDCDNTLVLSEPLAFESCTELGNLILKQHLPADPAPFQYTESELQEEFVGLNFRGLVTTLGQKHGFEVPPTELDDWVSRELESTTSKLAARAVPCEGVMEVLDKLQSEHKYGLAVVSSSAMSRVQAALKKTDQTKYFGDRVFSAASMEPPTSKPDPAVYLHACEKLGVKPEECVAIEDSKSGATAAMRAGIHVLGYVGPYYDDGGIEKVKQMEKTLTQDCKAEGVMHHWKDFEDWIRKIEAA